MIDILAPRTLASTLAMGLALAASAPAHADDDTDTALLAYLGLEAASGKSSLGEHGGEIEAWLLTSGAIEAAAQRIADTALAVPNAPQQFVVLKADEKVDFAAARLIFARLNDFAARFAAAGGCSGPAAQDAFAAHGGLPTPTLADVVGAIKTDKTITGIEVTPTDTRCSMGWRRASTAAA